MKKRMQRIAVCFVLAAMTAGASVGGMVQSAQAATEHFTDASVEAKDWEDWKENWDAFSSDYERVSLTPGVDETQLNLAWYSKTAELPVVRFSTSADMSDYTEFTGTQSDAVEISGVQYYSNKVTVTGLNADTTYYYQVFKDVDSEEASDDATGDVTGDAAGDATGDVTGDATGDVTGDATGEVVAQEEDELVFDASDSDSESEPEIYTYTTKSFDSFSFLYVGDPQIGASKGQTDAEGEKLNAASKGTTVAADDDLAARNDAYNWNKILNNATEDHPEVSFMVSAGDQVNYSQNEREYSAYLGASALTSLPVATTIGNHDSTSAQYTMHYNNPNAFDDSDTAYTEGKTAAGTDYYYSYGNTLFIVLDTNNYNCATHENVIKKAVEENPDAVWRIVTFHQDIYGSGADHSDSDGMVLRTQLTPLMDKYDIDVVLQGHDHTYSRTYQLQGDGQEHTAYSSTLAPNASDEDKANYSTQNNCYTIVNTTAGGTVTNPQGTVYLEANSSTGSKYYNLIATQQDFISERSQTWTPTYSVVDVDDDSFTVTTYDSTTRKQLAGSSSYTILKTEEPTETKLTGTEKYTKTIGDKAFTLDMTADNQAALTYESDNEDVAVVSKSGKVTITGVGTAHITVTAPASDLTLEADKTVTITVADKKKSTAATVTAPKKQTISVSNKVKRKLTVKWKKDTKASGYQLVYADNKGFSKNVNTIKVKKNGSVSYTVKKLKKGKTLYVKVRSYKTVKGKTYYGAYSSVKKVKVK